MLTSLSRTSLCLCDKVSGNESYVQGCAFHDGFSPAIGIFETTGLSVDDNIVHHTVGEGELTQSEDKRWTSIVLQSEAHADLCAGIRVWGDQITLRRNLVLLTLWPGSYQDRQESSNIQWNAAIEVCPRKWTQSADGKDNVLKTIEDKTREQSS